jgi:SAM-dependent methyltransferase
MIQAEYCLLYHQLNQNESKSTDDPSEETNNAYWQTFEWTSHELQETQEILESNLSTSDLIQNHPQGRGQYIKDNLEHNAHQHWDKFYTHHQTKFFKDRHYLHKAFPQEFGILYPKSRYDAKHTPFDTNTYNDDDDDANESHDTFTVMEIGCGVGNTVLPLLELHPWIVKPHSKEKQLLQVWGLDFSSIAIDLLKQDERFLQANNNDMNNDNDNNPLRNATTTIPPRAHAAVWDITQHFPQDIDSQLYQAADISMLLFCFSAIAPSKMVQAAKHVADTLKPGGVLIFRDYGRYDEAQIKLGTSRRKRLGDNYYVKHDLTRVYYFDLEDLRRLFGRNDSHDKECVGAGLEVLELKYIQRLYTNRSKGDVRRRVWVQGRFRKPM